LLQLVVPIFLKKRQHINCNQFLIEPFLLLHVTFSTHCIKFVMNMLHKNCPYISVLNDNVSELNL